MDSGKVGGLEKSHKKEEVAESYDRLCPKEMGHIEEEKSFERKNT